MESLKEFALKNNIAFSEKEPMAQHTSFKIGGRAEMAVFPKSTAEIALVAKFCSEKGVKLTVLGNGTNVLVSDAGIGGCVMLLGNAFSEIKLLSEDTVFAESGASLARLCNFALEKGLTGLEFAFGIPGTVGGAVFMNAGAYGGEIKDVLRSVCHIEQNGTEGSLSAEEASLSYRHSIYEENGFIITGAYFKLQKGNVAEIKEKMNELLAKRREKQPLEYPSAGSTFKRPPGHYAAQLIEQCNLKGICVGGAEVSAKHAGFIINKGGATAKDVLSLAKKCQREVLAQTGVELETEIRFIE